MPLRSAIVSTDALLAGQLDVIVGTTTSMLVLWDKSNGDVRAVSALGGQVLTLVTRNPNIHSIVDFGPTDRIAVPSVRQGPHSLVIGLALDKALGPGSFSKLDQIQVQSGHADAVTMILNPTHEVNSHFSTLPYVETELKSVNPKIHAVLTSSEVFGGPTTTISAYATRRFVEANPIKTAALVAALDEANEVIAKDRLGAAASYIAVSHERFAPDVLADMLTREGVLYSRRADPDHGGCLANGAHGSDQARTLRLAGVSLSIPARPGGKLIARSRRTVGPSRSIVRQQMRRAASDRFGA